MFKVIKIDSHVQYLEIVKSFQLQRLFHSVKTIEKEVIRSCSNLKKITIKFRN